MDVNITDGNYVSVTSLQVYSQIRLHMFKVQESYLICAVTNIQLSLNYFVKQTDVVVF